MKCLQLKPCKMNFVIRTIKDDMEVEIKAINPLKCILNKLK